MIDPRSVFIDQGTKDVTKAEFNLNSDEELAQERFKKDISVLNFFFDTPIITQIGLEMRVSMFDKLSAIGGTLGLYTGISIITLIETLWWLLDASSFSKDFPRNSLMKYFPPISPCNENFSPELDAYCLPEKLIGIHFMWGS